MMKLFVFAPGSRSAAENVKVTLPAETASPPAGFSFQYRLTVFETINPEVPILGCSIGVVLPVRVPGVVTLRDERSTGV